jgi:energy-coupling factor transporter ATP-binding protein EcfA2
MMVDKIFEVVNDIHQQGTTILLVEQNASRALQLASRGYVMDSGEVTMSGGRARAPRRSQGPGCLSRRVRAAAPDRHDAAQGVSFTRLQRHRCEGPTIESGLRSGVAGAG